MEDSKDTPMSTGEDEYQFTPELLSQLKANREKYENVPMPRRDTKSIDGNTIKSLNLNGVATPEERKKFLPPIDKLVDKNNGAITKESKEKYLRDLVAAGKAIEPSDITKVSDFKTIDVGLTDSRSLFDAKKKAILAKVFSNEILVNGYRSDEYSSFETDFLGYVPLLNIPVRVSPLYTELVGFPVPPFIDSFKLIAFYRRVMSYIAIHYSIFKSRLGLLQRMLYEAIDKDNIQLVDFILGSYAEYNVKPKYIQKQLKKVSEKMKTSKQDAKEIIRKEIIKSIKRVKPVLDFVESGDISKPRFCEDVVPLLEHLFEIWNKYFWESWDKLQLKYTAITPEAIEKYIDMYNDTTVALLYFYETAIVHSLSLSGFFDVENLNAVCSTIKIVPLELIDDETVKDILNTRVSVYNYRSKVTRTFNFNKDTYVLDSKFISKVDIEMQEKFYNNHVINTPEDIKSLLDARKAYGAARLEDKKLEQVGEQLSGMSIDTKEENVITKEMDLGTDEKMQLFDGNINKSPIGF
jgi:hypothetical protein